MTVVVRDLHGARLAVKRTT